MAIRSRDLRASRLLPVASSDNEDPMSSMGNLMDVMLVFACALMIALLAHYNVNLTSSDPVIADAEPLEGELTDTSIDASGNDSSYIALGTVYQDTNTGDLYVVQPEEDE